MLVEYSFAVIKLRYIHAGMILIPAYRPDGLLPAAVQTLIDSAGPVRSAYVVEKVDIDGARAERRVKFDLLHKHCVDFHAQVKSRFRTDDTIRERIDRLLVDDQSFEQTLTRAEVLSALWAALPLVGAPPAAFTVGRGTDPAVTLAAFDTLREQTRVLHAGIPMADQLFQEKEADLHKKQKEMEDLAAAALAQGRSQFDEGTPERELIDAIPTESPRSLPGKAVITGSTSPGSGVASVTYECDGATSFDILQREEGAGPFILVGDDVLAKSFEVTGLSPGPHEFVVRGRNARGMGEESDITVVEVQV